MKLLMQQVMFFGIQRFTRQKISLFQTPSERITTHRISLQKISPLRILPRETRHYILLNFAKISLM